MNRFRQKLVSLLTALAFLSPQIVGATKFELLEVHETAEVVNAQRGTLAPVLKMHAVLDQEIYSSKPKDNSGPNDSSPAPVTGHRHCSFSLAGCMALMVVSDRIALIPMHNCKVRPSQQSLAETTLDSILPPPKRRIQGKA